MTADLFRSDAGKRMPVRNLHIYPSPLTNESRIMKEAESLLGAGVVDEVVVAGQWREGLPEEEVLGRGLRLVRLRTERPSRSGLIGFLLAYLTFQWDVIKRFRSERWDLVTCHSLSVLGVGAYLKARHKVPLIYDAHELETEVEGARGMKKLLGKLLEQLWIPAVDHTVVVSDSIREWYQRRYGMQRISVVRNVPKAKFGPERSRVFRHRFNIPDDVLVFVYQGVLSRGRGVDTILEVFSDLPERFHIVFMGRGELDGEISAAAERRPNIHLHEMVPPDELCRYTSSADVGIHLIRNTCLNHYYCAPNKIFEYLLCGIPQIISDFPEMTRVLDEGRCGWGIEPTAASLRRTILSLDRGAVDEKRRNVLDARGRWGWHFEERALIEAYTGVLETVA